MSGWLVVCISVGVGGFIVAHTINVSDGWSTHDTVPSRTWEQANGSCYLVCVQLGEAAFGLEVTLRLGIPENECRIELSVPLTARTGY